MFRKVKRTGPKLILWGSTVTAIVNAFTFESPLVGFLAMIGVLWGLSKLLGPVFLNKQQNAVQVTAGFIAIISIFSIAGSIIYYTLPVTTGYLALTLAIIVGFVSIIKKKTETRKLQDKFINLHPIVTTAILGCVIALSTWFFIIFQVSIESSARTPWEFVSPISIALLGFCLLFIFGLLHRERATKIVLPIFILTFFAAVSMAAFIYPHGFGFDPFIHRATVSHISEFGTITPKPFYYIGQYSLELFSSKLFSLPIDLVDRFLVPVLSSLMIIGSAAVGFFLTFKEKKLVPLLAICFLPLSAFIATTPQSLAYIFTASLLFLSLPRLIGKEYMVPNSLLGIITAAALITHPLAGIPAAIYFLMMLVGTSEFGYPNLKITALTIITILGATALPIIFSLQAKLSGLDIVFAPQNAFDFSRLNLTWFFENRFHTTLDGVYLVIDNLLWIVLILATIGIIFSIKNKAKPAFYLPALAVLMWLINYWLLSSTLEFEFLIEYERANYAERLITLAIIFAMPMVAVAISGIHKILTEKPKILHISFAILITLVASANIYGAYPRHDNYALSAGFNVGTSDFDAVYTINDKAGEEEFIVLANQAVSAAALETFGFKKYYDGDIFYYPIPTGGELYTKYLEMTDEEPTRAVALDAMDIAGVNLMFFVVNDYWWQSEKIIENAKLEANDWFAVGDGEVTVFEYRRD